MAAKKFIPTQPPSPVSRSGVTKLEQGAIVAPANPIFRNDLKGITIDIAEKPSVISHNPLDFSYLIYGPKKTGKTDFSSMFGGDHESTYCLMYEKTARHLSIRQTLIDDEYDEEGKLEVPAWLKGEAYLEYLITNPGNIKVICFDGLKAGYDKAFSQGCREGGFSHPALQSQGGLGWDKIKKTFYRFVDRLIGSNFGVVFNCHDIALTLDTALGSRSQIIPNLPTYADDFVRHKVDNVFYFHIREKKRWLQLRSDGVVYAACAHKENFLTPDGQPIWLIPMGDSAEEGYRNFIQAFNNKQINTYEEVTKKDIDELKKVKGDTTAKRIKEKK